LVSDFLANLTAAPNASVRVINSQGIENTGFLKIGDRVEVFAGDNSTKVDYDIINILDAVKNIKNSSICIYPNPSSGNFTLSGLAPGSKIKVSNILGRQLLEKTANQDKIQLALEGQPGGIYILKISNGPNVLACVKLIVK